jgi:hypothetical protein
LARDNYIDLETALTIDQVGRIFQSAVARRPLKLKTMKSEFFKPTPANDPFDGLDLSDAPDFEVGATLELAFGPDPAAGTVVCSCFRRTDGTSVILRSSGNMRGRLFTNSLMRHVVSKLVEADPSIGQADFRGRAGSASSEDWSTPAVEFEPTFEVQPHATASTAVATNPARWTDDPTGRHQLRYWDGTAWTDHVSDNGQTSRDPIASSRGARSARASTTPRTAGPSSVTPSSASTNSGGASSLACPICNAIVPLRPGDRTGFGHFATHLANEVRGNSNSGLRLACGCSDAWWDASSDFPTGVIDHLRRVHHLPI